MASEAKQAVKLPPISADDKDAYPLSTVRAHPAARKVIDLAAVLSDQDRGEFLLEAGFARAVETLGADRAREILDAA